VSFTTTASKTEVASPIPGLASPTYGASTLSLNASDLIDVGFLSLQNIGVTDFSAAAGDIRGGGLLYAAGTINLLAGQIYTPTAATFTVAAFNAGGAHPGTVNILADPGVSRPRQAARSIFTRPTSSRTAIWRLPSARSISERCPIPPPG
jgi:hypothetical protein